MSRLLHSFCLNFPIDKNIIMTSLGHQCLAQSKHYIKVGYNHFYFYFFTFTHPQPILTPSLHMFTKNTNDLYVAKSNNSSVTILLEVQAAVDNVNTFFLEHPSLVQGHHHHLPGQVSSSFICPSLSLSFSDPPQS